MDVDLDVDTDIDRCNLTLGEFLMSAKVPCVQKGVSSTFINVTQGTPFHI